MHLFRTTRTLFVVSSACLLLAPWAWVSAKTQMAENREAPSIRLQPRLRSVLFVQQQPSPAKTRPSKKSDIHLPEGEGKDTAIRLCGTCHGTDVFARQRHDKDKWNQIIDNMTSKGMEASDDDLDKVATYLAAYLGPNSPPVESATPKPSKTNP